MKKSDGKAWVVSVSMGYGHQRTAYVLRDLSPDGMVVNANDYGSIPPRDKKIWETSRRFYEFISNFRRVPIIGPFIFSLFDQFQKIMQFYPRRDLSRPTLNLWQIFSLVKRGWGRDLIEHLSKKEVPLLTTFFTPAFMAEVFNYPAEIYCVIPDADISRTWVSLNPKKSRIKYFASTERAAERLKLYGVDPENVFLTGYPLPKENLGSPDFEVAKRDLGYRLVNLDPSTKYRIHHGPLITRYIGPLPKKSDHPLTILFSVGGAGAQKEIGVKIVESLKEKIKNGEARIVLSAGIKEGVRDYFVKAVHGLGLKKFLGETIHVLYETQTNNYFKSFNEALHTTDILWTKPSELSFYSALGIPIIIAPTLGSQEEFNREWLLAKGAGIPQSEPKYANEWLFDFLKEGRFAEAAMEGFIDGNKNGVFNIEAMVSRRQ